jgi:hypothetical protein
VLQQVTVCNTASFEKPEGYRELGRYWSSWEIITKIYLKETECDDCIHMWRS